MATYNKEDNTYTITKEDGPVLDQLKLAIKIADETKKPLTFCIPDMTPSMGTDFTILPDSTLKNALDSYHRTWREAQARSIQNTEPAQQTSLSPKPPGR